MGRGIVLLLLQRVAQGDHFRVTIVDTDPSQFDGVKEYFRYHLQKIDSKRVAVCLQALCFLTRVEECGPADLVFEAIIENVEIKADVLAKVDKATGGRAIFFTNTSSIPIHVLEEKARLKGRILGFHFYNPPPVQQLVEMITPKGAPKDLKTLGLEMGEKLKKRIVPSTDIAGFIGNGHFMREIVFAWHLVERLSHQMSLSEALVVVNTVYQEWLLRPMGIFQLVDYVGIDVCTEILKIMRTFLEEDALHCPYLERLIGKGVRGGQHPDGSQKSGIFEYQEGLPKGVYDVEKGLYMPYKAHSLGNGVTEGLTWRSLLKDPEREVKIAAYFKRLSSEDLFGAQLAMEMLSASHAIGKKLVEEGVAHSLEDVNTVLRLGFYHLYGVGFK